MSYTEEVAKFKKMQASFSRPISWTNGPFEAFNLEKDGRSMGRLWPAMESLETPPEYYTVKKGLKDPEKALDALCFEIYKQTKLVVFYSNAVPCDDSKTTCRCQPRTVTCALFLGRQRKEECATWAQKETIGALLGLTQNGVIEVEPTCEDLSV